MVKVIFIRHGYSVFNKERRFCGQYDAPLIGFNAKQVQHTGYGGSFSVEDQVDGQLQLIAR